MLGSQDLIDGQPYFVAIGPFAEVHVQPHAQRRMLASIVSRMPTGWPADHQTGARDDAMLKRRDDSAIDRVTLAEVVGIDDDPTTHANRGLRHKPSLSAAFSASSTQSLPSSPLRCHPSPPPTHRT